MSVFASLRTSESHGNHQSLRGAVHRGVAVQDKDGSEGGCRWVSPSTAAPPPPKTSSPRLEGSQSTATSVPTGVVGRLLPRSNRCITIKTAYRGVTHLSIIAPRTSFPGWSGSLACVMAYVTESCSRFLARDVLILVKGNVCLVKGRVHQAVCPEFLEVIWNVDRLLEKVVVVRNAEC